MDSMHCWLLARWGNALRLCALSMLAYAFLFVDGAVGQQGPLLFERPSTIDLHVPVQDLDLQATVVDLIDRGLLSDKPTTATRQTREESAKKRPSPFQKWISPKSEVSNSISPDKPKTQAIRQPTTTRNKSASRHRLSSKRLAKATSSKPSSKDERSIPISEERTQTSNNSGGLLPPLSQSQQNLRKKIRRVLTHYAERPLNTRDRSPWELMHAMLAYETKSEVLQGGPQGKPITAVGWLCFNQPCKRRQLMYINNDGKIRVRVGPALQGHRGQLLAMLAQCKVSADYPMRIEDQEFSVADLIKMEMETCYPRTELTFKLIGLSHYLKSDATWLNEQGMSWDIPRLIAEEIRQPIRGVACGGTHRLAGLTLAYKNRIRRGEPVDGEYLKAQRFVSRYQQYAYRLQNPDGSFSTEWFRGPGNEQSLDRKLKTTGHLLEWLLYAATEKELKSWRTTKAANYLANIMLQNRYKNWEAGPLGHAIHALLLYDRMVFSPYDAHDASDTLQAEGSRRTRRKR